MPNSNQFHLTTKYLTLKIIIKYYLKTYSSFSPICGETVQQTNTDKIIEENIYRRFYASSSKFEC